MNFVSRRRVWTLPVLLAMSCGMAAAQSYPTRPMTLVVPYPPGGDTDAIPRMLGEQLASRLGQPVLVDNRASAGGTIGAALVARAPKDGYTLLFTPNFLSIAPFVMKLGPSNSYDPLQSFEPVIQSASQPLLLVAHPSTGFKTVADMVRTARSGKEVNYGSPGAGTPMQVLAEMLNRAAETKIRHIPYRGVGPVVTDVVAGHVQTAWNGILAPKGTPASVVSLLNTQVNDILKSPEVVMKLATFGAIPAGGAPASLAKVNEDDYNVLGNVIRELNISAE